MNAVQSRTVMTREGVTAGLLVSLLLFWGCISSQTGGDASSRTEISSDTPLIIAIDYLAEASAVVVQGNQRLVYTSVKQTDPLGIVLYLPETRLGASVQDVIPMEGSVSHIAAGYADENQSTVKLTILLDDPFEYEMAEQENGLKVLFSTAPKDASPSADMMEADLTETSGQASAFTIHKDGNGNKVIFTGSAVGASETGSGGIDSAPSAGSDVVIPSVPTRLEDIQFGTLETGESVITVITGHPVDYDIKTDPGNPDQMRLFLKNTEIPLIQRRPLITTFFDSAVERVLPVQKGPAGNAHILINLRTQAPHRIVRNDNQLQVIFDPVRISSPRFSNAVVKLEGSGARPVLSMNRSMTSTAGDIGASAGRPQQNVSENRYSDRNAGEYGQSALQDQLPGSAPQPVYTGEKISLDFFETDIKNVFRILRSISGENFAVDKDVTGSVTLTLDKPVPWDQVLDLVLKMNSLGKIREGDIIRVATQATLKREYDLEQEALAARRKAIEQQKQLEPMVTEYIPINYSNAETDIKPHLEKILTPDRGQLSVDSRTNMIIMTDVQAKVNQAKDMINRLDMVTPQIMIAARVVEVNKDFSRELGIDWNMSSQDVYRDDLGGTYGFDVAMNYPASTTSGIGYSFSRLTGTPFALDVRLSAAEERGDGKIISSPRVLTLDNQKATITQGLQYPYQVIEDDEPETKFADIDLSLDVTPHVTPDRRVNMDVVIKKSDIAGFSADNQPIISRNETQTQLLVNDGNTIVIGGIVKRTTTDDTDGFPILSGIPMLGYLFRNDKTIDSKSELLIFLTPTIVQLDQKMNN